MRLAIATRHMVLPLSSRRIGHAPRRLFRNICLWNIRSSTPMLESQRSTNRFKFRRPGEPWFKLAIRSMNCRCRLNKRNKLLIDFQDISFSFEIKRNSECVCAEVSTKADSRPQGLFLPLHERLAVSGCDRFGVLKAILTVRIFLDTINFEALRLTSFIMPEFKVTIVLDS
jgi:hypothetical protein